VHGRPGDERYPPKRRAQERRRWHLYETGAYAWCRNPLYVANGIILVGLTLLFDSR
jgi:protein-S-isoprenylcysteine O-methyltransferase Ste14